jgi:hypothetical protein
VYGPPNVTAGVPPQVVQGVVVPELLELLPPELLPPELLPAPDEELLLPAPDEELLLPAPDEELPLAPEDEPLDPEPLLLDAPELDEPLDPPELFDPELPEPFDPPEPDPLEPDCPVSVGLEVPHCTLRTETAARQPMTLKTECFLIVASPTVEKTASLEHGTRGAPRKKIAPGHRKTEANSGTRAPRPGRWWRLSRWIGRKCARTAVRSARRVSAHGLRTRSRFAAFCPSRRFTCAHPSSFDPCSQS